MWLIVRIKDKNNQAIWRRLIGAETVEQFGWKIVGSLFFRKDYIKERRMSP